MSDENATLARDLLTAEEVQGIRRDERLRCAALLDENAATIGGFAPGGERTVRLVALLLSLPYGDGS